jgi:aminopeptidase N
MSKPFFPCVQLKFKIEFRKEQRTFFAREEIRMTLEKSFKVFLLSLAAVMTIMTRPAPAEDSQKRPSPEYNLFVSFDLQTNSLKGTANIVFPETTDIVVSTGDLMIMSASLNGSMVEYNKKEGVIKASGKGTLAITYHAVFRGEQGKTENLQNAGVVQGGLVSTEGISLTGNWYPSLKGPAYYRLTAVVPAGFTAISEADEVTYKETPAGREYKFSFPYPLNGIDFAAGKYREVKGTVAGIDIYAYFFPEDVSLADIYIEYSKKYFEMYNRLLVPYPYKRFSVVENLLPTGYSMPTFTLLGREVVRLPFIVQTSLGHEITHQWFGNYVYADFAKGNWLEGITTYLSDHLYEEQKGTGWEYRKKILTDYQSYVTAENEFPLRDFYERTGPASMAIGYGKGAMLFHMLRTLVGDEAFYGSLRRLIETNRFREATWEDIRASFEVSCGADLGWFFSQWLDRKGVPSLEATDAGTQILKGAPAVSFSLLQKGEVYRLKVPLKIVSGKEKATEQIIDVKKEKQYFDITAGEDPRTLIIDENYDVMRRLGEDEYPPVISRLLGDEKRLIVYSEKEKGIYEDLIRIFKDEGFATKEVSELRDEDIRTSSIFVLGYDSPVLKRLFGEVKGPGPGFVLTVTTNPLNTAKVVAYAAAGSREEAGLAARKIFHYGKYSTIRFEMGKNVEKEIAETDRGMIFTLADPVEGVSPKASLALDSIIDNVADTPVIFVGERHTNYGDHKVELDVIMNLYNKGRKFAVGMEMFQRPFQKAIDEYLSGAIGERELLKRTEYFKRWGYDYHLYREILEFAKAKGIPIVALNLRSEIINKVSSGGIDALSEKERREIPQDMDMSDAAYRTRMREVFESHPAGSTFDNFYQSQILWDETMAHSAADFLRERPGYQLVVLAGAEHIMYDSGIPQRLKRLTGRDYATLINGTYDVDIGSYVIFANELDSPFSAKLGVILKKRDDRVVIEGLSDDGAAAKAGMTKGDVIVSVDDWKIETVDDVRIALFEKKPYESVRIKVKRKKFFVVEEDIEFNVPL